MAQIETVIPIRLPKPHPKQLAIRDSPAKRKVICAGRRSGKTTLAAMIAVEGALQKRRVLLAAPVQQQTDAFWEKCKTWLGDAIQQGHVYKNETRRTLEFSMGGRIGAKTAWDADTLRGDYADRLLLDEYALMASDAWELVGAPMLLDNDGDAWFFSTPHRKNHFHALYARGASGDDPRWQSWHFTSYDNPYLSREALAEVTHDLTEEATRQEIMAEFLEGEGAVFRNIAACLHAPLGATPAQHLGHSMVAGVDWGKHKDYTVISVLCQSCRQEVALERFNQIDYILQRGRLMDVWQRWGIGRIVAEANAMGEPIIEVLANEGLPVEGFQTTAQSKSQIIESLALAFERKEWQWLDVPVATAELEAFERTMSRVTGRSSYAAPAGYHDDTVVARAIALYGMGRWHGIGIWDWDEHGPI